ncbi:hypothetical protein [Mesorhizobium sp. BE184]|uniref:hypothetical protein n=1 Tax=Mesorhizobium sp. BE184 TaxID=2817714 RepID=UPI00285671B3|nr:hypothetical protein [Mesorhizobium sp. BE184]MDR7032915.1 hypothetical protein [Mesorhizobium sp. BE184]
MKLNLSGERKIAAAGKLLEQALSSKVHPYQRRNMTDVVQRRDPYAALISTLAVETGVSEAEIRSIISVVGMDRASIIREARIIKRKSDG